MPFQPRIPERNRTSSGEVTVVAWVCKSGHGFTFAAIVGGCLISTTAWATTIHFDGLPGDRSPFTSYTEAGFTVDPVSGSWLVGQNYGHPPPFIYFYNPPDTTASIAVTGGDSLFSFKSLDLYSSITKIPFTFTGL